MGENSDRLSSVSFFCPAYHDEGNLPLLIPKVHKLLQEITDTFEIIIVEDGSPDKTAEVADQLAKQFSNVRVIHHEKNQGYGAALRDGFLNAQYDYIFYTDGDNQYDVNEFKPYFKHLKDYDILNGYAIKKAVTPRRLVQSIVFNALTNILFFSWFKDVNCSIKMYKSSVIKSMDIKCFSAFIDAEMLIKAKRLKFKIFDVPVTHYERKTGLASGSKFNVIWDTIKDMVRFRLGIL